MAETTQEQRQTLAIYIEKHAALQVTIPAALAIGLLRDLDAAEAEARGLGAMLDGVNGVLKQVEAERDVLRCQLDVAVGVIDRLAKHGSAYSCAIAREATTTIHSELEKVNG